MYHSMARRCFFILCFGTLGIIIMYINLMFSFPSTVKKTLSDRIYKSFHPENFFDRDFQDNNSISSQQCFIPKMITDDPSLRDLMKQHEPLRCSPMTNWVYTKDGKFYINKSSENEFGEIKCDYYNIRRSSDDIFVENPVVKDIKNGTNLIGDSFRVVCKAAAKGFLGMFKPKRKYTNIHVGVPVPKNLHSSLEMNSKKHVFIFLLDSMSRINFIRKLPNFYQLLTDTMNGFIMEGFNIVGDGTPWAVIPMTTGKFQTELPEARKRFKNSTYLDKWPFIWKEYENAGYITSYAEEQPAYSAFSYKLKGFNKQPFHHYLRSMLFVAEKEKSRYKPYCLGDTPKSLVWPKFWRELRHMYDKFNRKTFSFLFSSETSHDDYNLVQILDKHLTYEFSKLHSESLLDDSFLIVMGDHGRRFGPVRQTQSGKLEEKLPFLAIVPPKNYHKTHPKNYHNLKLNVRRLITVFDLHATLKSILSETVDLGGKGELRNRSISLLREVPVERSCRDADIKPHFCSCLIWTDIFRAENDTIVGEGAKRVVEKFNNLLSEATSLCSTLSLHSIVSARKAAPNVALMSFKESFDYDNYIPNLSGDNAVTNVLYQIRFITQPGSGDWEVSMTYFVEIKQFVINLDDISRLNEYGEQPKCIINSHQHLRQYCYCI